MKKEKKNMKKDEKLKVSKGRKKERKWERNLKLEKVGNKNGGKEKKYQ